MKKSRGLLAKSGSALRESRKEALFSELHSLLSSGLDFSRSFELLIDGESDPGTKSLLRELYGSVVRGDALWTAIGRCGRFTPLDSGVVRIGEETGRLEESLSFLSGYYRKRTEQRRMVGSAVSYPLVILCTAVAVVIFMVLVIVPMFEQVYSRMGGELPALTRWIISLSKSFPAYLCAFVLAGAVLAFVWLSFRDAVPLRRSVAALLLHLPLCGDILRKNYQSRFCKLLYLLAGSGVPLLHGIGMLADILTFYPYQQAFGSICAGLERGEPFAGSLARFPGLFDKKLVTLLRVGEETNRLPEMLRKQGDDLARELEFRLKNLGNLLEPLLVLMVGALVALILIAMYLPMFRLGNVMN